jgi:hypothetical protein
MADLLGALALIVERLVFEGSHQRSQPDSRLLHSVRYVRVADVLAEEGRSPFGEFVRVMRRMTGTSAARATSRSSSARAKSDEWQAHVGASQD